MAKVKWRQLPARQRIRKELLLVSFLALPITLFYLSPYLIHVAAAQGVVNGSLLVFAGMLVESLFVGRLWCDRALLTKSPIKLGR
jgi:hypothetical protein